MAKGVQVVVGVIIVEWIQLWDGGKKKYPKQMSMDSWYVKLEYKVSKFQAQSQWPLSTST